MAFYSKKSDALAGRVNTFIVLHTKEFKWHFDSEFVETFKFTNFKILSL
jgi:hypothetical protein